MRYCRSVSEATAGGQDAEPTDSRAQPRNVHKGKCTCAEVSSFQAAASGAEAEINGLSLSSPPRRCIVLQQTLVAMVSCVRVMKSGPGEGYQPLQEWESY